MKLSPGKQAIMLVLVFLIAGASFYALSSISFFNIESVEVTNHGLVTKTTSEVSRIVQPLKGQNIFAVRINRIKKQILQTDAVSEVRIRRWFPNRILVDISYDGFYTKIHNEDSYFLAKDNSLVKVSKDVFDSYTEIKEVKIDGHYCDFLEKWGYDKGFFQAVYLIGSVESNLISDLKYDNNNGNDFGRLIIEFRILGAQLWVNEAVSSKRINDAIDILKNNVRLPDTILRYDLYSESMVKRN